MKERTQFIARLAILIALTLIIQMIGLPQPATGPVINMLLFLTFWILDLKAAIIIGTLTPLIAVWRGQLPAILFPMIPFIIAANTVLVIALAGVIKFARHFLKTQLKSHPHIFDVIGILISSFCKFIVLFLAAKILLPLLMGTILPEKAIFMMSTPQLITAFIGGGLALALVHFLKRIRILN